MWGRVWEIRTLKMARHLFSQSISTTEHFLWTIIDIRKCPVLDPGKGTIPDTGKEQ